MSTTLASAATLHVADAPPIDLESAAWDDIVAELTRRGFLVGGGGLLGAAALSGCGGPGAKEADSGADQIKYSYQGFSATIPAKPKRVVTCEGRTDIEFSLLVGYPVVASAFTWGREGRLFAELGEDYAIDKIEPIKMDGWKPVLEDMARHQPDLIVLRRSSYDSNFNDNAALTKIAPLLVVSEGSSSWSTHLSDQLTALDRADQRDREKARFERILAESTQALGDLPKQLTIAAGAAHPTEPSVTVWRNASPLDVYDRLGFTQPFYDRGVAADGNDDLTLAAENLDQLAKVDVLYLQNYSKSPVRDLGTLKRLPAYKAGRVFEFDGTLNQALSRAATGICRMAVDDLTST